MARVREETLFGDVPLEEKEIRGRRFRFPIRYYDHETISGAFPASATKIRRLLPSPRLEPVEAGPGVILVRMTGFEYHVIDGLEPYNEFSIGVPVLYRGAEHSPGLPGACIIHLPVTTEEARWVGVDLYGFPKFLAEITFDETVDARRCVVRADGMDVITLEVRKVPATAESTEFFVYTPLGRDLVRTPVQVKGQWGTGHVTGGALCNLGDHPIVSGLRDIDLERASVEHAYAPKRQMLLHQPGERLPL